MIIRFVIMVLALPLTCSYVYTGYQAFVTHGGASSAKLHLFLMGFAAFIPVWFLWVRHNHFLNTFEHEMTHMIVGLLMFKPPHELRVTHGSGGHVVLQVGNNFIIPLAPYFLPTTSYILLLFYPLLAANYYPYFFILLGIVTSYHMFSTWQETSLVQTDIHLNGVAFSLLFILFANVLMYGLLLIFVIAGWKAGAAFLVDGLANIKVLMRIF